MERVWLAAEGIDPPFTIRAIMRPARMPAAAAWVEAWAALVAVRPGLRLRAQGRLRAARWIADAPSPVEVLDDDWDGWSDHPILHAPVDPWTGPTMRLVVMRQVVVLSVHHAVADGRCCWRIASDLLNILDGGEPRPAPLARLDSDVVSALSLPTHHDPPPDRLTPFARATDALGFVWARRALTPRSQLLARLIAGLAGQGDQPLRLGIPVDLRRHLPAAEQGADGNLTGVAHIEVDAEVAPERAQAQVRAALDAHLAEAHAAAADAVRGYPLWLMRWAGRQAAKRQRRTGLYPVSATLSNLGRLPLTLAGAPVEACCMPPYNRGMPLLITLVGDAQSAQLVAVAPAALGDAGRLDARLDGMCEGLTA